MAETLRYTMRFSPDRRAATLPKRATRRGLGSQTPRTNDLVAPEEWELIFHYGHYNVTIHPSNSH
jgi:hypothetical protein